MFGIRVLIYLLGIALVVWILIRLARGSGSKKKPLAQMDDMVQCAHCGTFLPRHEATQDGDRYYCSTGHRDQDRQ
jgi:uncharacterized protein